ncbi:hypothetical protein ES703_98652 [subsurface metagenome]
MGQAGQGGRRSEIGDQRSEVRRQTSREDIWEPSIYRSTWDIIEAAERGVVAG